MTSTKILYLFAAVVPFGCAILGIIALVHFLAKRHKAKAAVHLAPLSAV